MGTAVDRHDVRVGAYELYLSGGGGKKNMSCACHWAVNQAASDAAGRMWGIAYSVLPSAIYVPADPLDVDRYFRGLKRAQMELDLEPERYKHYYLKEIPERYQSGIDVRCFGPGERVVFLPYTADMYERAQSWMRDRGLFEERESMRPYESVVQV
jgi:hypothetical protein